MSDNKIVQYLENQIKENSKSLVFARLASLYLEQGRIDDAVNLLEQGIQTNPSYVTGHFILAKAFIADNQREKAEEALKKVISHDHSYLKAHKLLGDLMARIGWENKAAIHYRDILSIDPLDEETEQMLDTFSFSVEPAATPKITSSEKERKWVSGSPPIFERSAKVSERKQELTKSSNIEKSSVDELDLSDFDLDSFTPSENIEQNMETPKRSSGLTDTGELDLSDFDLESISSSAQEQTSIPEKPPILSDNEVLLSPASITENKKNDLDAVLLPEEEPEKEEPFFEEEFLTDISASTLENMPSEKASSVQDISDTPDLNDISDFFEEEEKHSETESNNDLFRDEDVEGVDEEANNLLRDENEIIESTELNEKLSVEESEIDHEPKTFSEPSDKPTVEHPAQQEEQKQKHTETENSFENTLNNNIPDQATEEILENSEIQEPELEIENKNKESLKIVSPTLGEIYSAQGQFKKAIHVYETLIEKYPEDEIKYTQKIGELRKKLEESAL